MRFIFLFLFCQLAFSQEDLFLSIKRPFIYSCDNMVREMWMRDISDFDDSLGVNISHPEVLSKDFHVIFSSGGGGLVGASKLMKSFMDSATYFKQQTGRNMEVFLTKECSSACVAVAGFLNKMAKNGDLDFFVEGQTKIGFHGGSTRSGPSDEATLLMKKLYLDSGITSSWLSEHDDVFKSLRLTYFPAEGEDIQTSELLTHAKMLNLEESLAMKRKGQNCWNPAWGEKPKKP